jgi:hypothetical protein
MATISKKDRTPILYLKFNGPRKNKTVFSFFFKPFPDGKIGMGYTVHDVVYLTMKGTVYGCSTGINRAFRERIKNGKEWTNPYTR